MNLCRFQLHTNPGPIHIGVVSDDHSAVLDLTPAGVTELTPLLESPNPVARLKKILRTEKNLPRLPFSKIKLRPPVERQEVWAAGVTYLRSKRARMDESDFSATAYDRVYTAARPELFFKSMPEKVVATGDSIGIRRDARWSVPEPELALVLNSRGQIVGHTIGNDMSSRDIEGENLLYLPQAKIYDRSCALGPWLHLGATESAARQWTIAIEIKRAGRNVFSGKTSVSQIKRRFKDLTAYLFRSQSFPDGAILLTGTGVVPSDEFTLQSGDTVTITISGIGILQNRVVVV